jgi:glycerol-3-phosphate dehydrogenase
MESISSVKDIFIIGGGINGTGIAADAAGRGLSVMLCEKGDLASGTSSYSTKLIHGGLRYLEFFEFNMVRKALREREILMKKAPHLIQPLEFVLPHESHLRPAWLIRLGLFLYDHLSARTLIPGPHTVNLTADERGKPLQEQFKKGFSYFDCFTDDARLVVENAIAAREHHAEILTHTEFLSAQRDKTNWKIHLKNTLTGGEYFQYAKALVNTAGPWVHEVNNRIIDNKTLFSIELVKGSHIIVPKLYEGNFAYILQNSDKRIVFAIPYQGQFTLIGTTDVSVDNVKQTAISEDEINYLCKIINNYFKKTITAENIIWAYSGVRCLQGQHSDNPSTTTRDYRFILDSNNETQALLTVIGGKLTTFRDLSENAVNKLQDFFPGMGAAWTANQPLPGGNFKNHNFESFYQQFKTDYPWLPEDLAHRYAKNYGTRASLFLNHTRSLSDLGKHIGAGLYQKEIEYLVQYEWAKTAEDILWRRTKLGLFLGNDDQILNQINNIINYIISALK